MKRYAFVGASSRGSHMYIYPLANEFSDCGQIVGLYDLNNKRSEVVRQKSGLDFPIYNSFEEMVKDSKPDIVVITCKDSEHHTYAIKAMEAGCDVILEKPMTIDEVKCNAILETEKRTGRKVIVTFNLRYAPFSTRIKELVAGGNIGKVLSVHFEWFLDTKHGADYFRRWHRRKENSGGLLIHKSTHHFDLINWIIGEDPVAISAFGSTRVYGPTRENRGKRCYTCDHKDSCEFYFDLVAEDLKDLYLDCEDVDGYYRDACVFDDEINIEDTVSLCVKYSGGASLSYALTAHSPYEGYRMVINGTGGRLEADCICGDIGAYAGQQIFKLRIYNRKNEVIDIAFPEPKGMHGGADVVLQRAAFKNDLPDPLGRVAGTRAGALSIIIGIAANKSIKEGKMVYVKDLLKEELL
jgi:predicted dehydrogenase